MLRILVVAICVYFISGCCEHNDNNKEKVLVVRQLVTAVESFNTRQHCAIYVLNEKGECLADGGRTCDFYVPGTKIIKNGPWEKVDNKYCDDKKEDK